MSTLSSHFARPEAPFAAIPVGPSQAVPAAVPPILAGVLRFHHRHARKLRPLLSRLAQQGQSPSQLFITCADSRIVPNVITGTGPGELFTIRNIGNLVPQHRPGADGGDASVAAAVEFATEALGVSAITVCGHSGCGAMAALLRAEDDAGAGNPGPAENRHSPLAEWLRHGTPSLDRLRAAEPHLVESAATTHERLCRLNVLQQLDHLAGYPSIEQRLAAGRLCLIGMYFDLARARVEVYDPRQERFTPVPG